MGFFIDCSKIVYFAHKLEAYPLKLFASFMYFAGQKNKK